nr:hypothetical protein [Tanacetum cinerariifolium]
MGFEYKHDYAVIDSPRAITFRDRYGVQMIMCFNEIHKFNDGTLHQIDKALDYQVKEFKIDKALDYQVKEFKVNRMNPGLNTRDLEAKFAQEDQIIREQIKTDYEIARIHAERELKMMITELDRSNEIVAKYLSEYEQAEARLSHDEKLGKESFKKLKTTEASGTEPSQEQQSEEPKELSEEDLKKMMDLVPVEELYIEAL